MKSKIWVWSEGGIDRFNGGGFEKMDTPFDFTYVNDMKSGANDDIWVMSYTYNADLNTYASHIWRYAQGGWTELTTSALSAAIELWNCAEDDGSDVVFRRGLF